MSVQKLWHEKKFVRMLDVCLILIFAYYLVTVINRTFRVLVSSLELIGTTPASLTLIYVLHSSQYDVMSVK